MPSSPTRASTGGAGESYVQQAVDDADQEAGAERDQIRFHHGAALAARAGAAANISCWALLRWGALWTMV